MPATVFNERLDSNTSATEARRIMFFPMMLAAESASLTDRVRRLEHALVLSLDGLQSVVERLESKFGPEFLGADLQHLSVAASDAELQGVLDRIDGFMGAGQKPAAARHFREAFGATWDQAHSAISAWNTHSREQKLRCLRLARYIKTLEAGGTN